MKEAKNSKDNEHPHIRNKKDWKPFNEFEWEKKYEMSNSEFLKELSSLFLVRPHLVVLLMVGLIAFAISGVFFYTRKLLLSNKNRSTLKISLYWSLGLVMILALGAIIYQTDNDYLKNLYPLIPEAYMGLTLLRVAANYLERKTKNIAEEQLGYLYTFAKKQHLRDTLRNSGTYPFNSFSVLQQLCAICDEGHTLHDFPSLSLDLSRHRLKPDSGFGIMLYGANLQGSNFSEADLSFSRFSLAESERIMANSKRKNLLFEEPTFLTGPENIGSKPSLRTYLFHCDFSSSNFQNADLSGANLTGSNLSNCDLSGANLSMIEIEGTNFSGANMLGSKISFWNQHLGVSRLDYRPRLGDNQKPFILPDGRESRLLDDLLQFT